MAGAEYLRISGDTVRDVKPQVSGFWRSGSDYGLMCGTAKQIAMGVGIPVEECIRMGESGVGIHFRFDSTQVIVSRAKIYPDRQSPLDMYRALYAQVQALVLKKNATDEDYELLSEAFSAVPKSQQRELRGSGFAPENV